MRLNSLLIRLSFSISLAVGATTAVEYILTSNKISQINESVLQQVSFANLETVQTALQKIWLSLPPDNQSTCCETSSFDRLLSGLVDTREQTILLMSSEGHIAGLDSTGLIPDSKKQFIFDALQDDQDGYIGPMIGSSPLIAIAGKQLTLEGVADELQPTLIVARRWRLIESLKSLHEYELKLKLFTLIVTVILSMITLKAGLSTLGKISKKAKSASLSNIEDSKIKLSSSPAEISDLVYAFNGMLDSLEQEYEKQKAFTSSISHEIRSPLTVICGFIESVLAREKLIQKRNVRSLEIALREGQRLTSLLSDLLDLSRAGRNQLSLTISDIDVWQFSLELRKILEGLFGHSVSVISKKYPKNRLFVADKSRLIQCLVNLSENALKYSQDGRKIAVRIECRDKCVLFRVVDHGQGISDKYLGQIFEQFFCVPGAKASSQKRRSGLGLAVVKMLVESMNGSINVKSKESKGSCFSIALPYNSESISLRHG